MLHTSDLDKYATAAGVNIVLHHYIIYLSLYVLSPLSKTKALPWCAFVSVDKSAKKETPHVLLHR